MKNTIMKEVLVIDDQLDNLQTIIDYFIEFDMPYSITRAPSGKIGLEIVKNKCPDLIICDWDMPDMNGIEFIKEFRKKESCGYTPIIMCTGVMTTSENLKMALNAGATDYIRKPIDKIELIARSGSAMLLAESQKKVLKQNQLLAELNTTKDKLFSIIGHDLRSPISSVMGMIEMLKKKYKVLEPDQIEEFLNLMFEGVENGFKLLENLLEWSRFQIGMTRFSPLGFGIKSLIDSNLKLLKPAADNKSIELSTNLKKNIVVHGDENMINTVLRNLLSNAIKFTRTGGKVSVSVIQKDKNVCISVEDTGIGMKRDDIDKLFKIGENFSTYGTENEKGTGLGLCLCNEFIEKHNSSIMVESEPEKGSKFSFVLPAGLTN
jgi:two-component system, sensor histidine kinase and response regulator